MAGHTVSTARDRLRHALQAPIVSPRFCVLYLSNGAEHRTAWFGTRELAQKALMIVRARGNVSGACVYMD